MKQNQFKNQPRRSKKLIMNAMDDDDAMATEKDTNVKIEETEKNMKLTRLDGRENR